MLAEDLVPKSRIYSYPLSLSLEHVNSYYMNLAEKEKSTWKICLPPWYIFIHCQVASLSAV